MSEFGFIESVRRAFAAIPDNGFEGIGDDCAVYPIDDSESLLFTADMLGEGVHFLRHAASPYEIGVKSLMVNLSDIAAMGGKPVATLLSLGVTADAAGEWVQEFMRGYRDVSERFGVALIGGDTTLAEERISVNVTAIGRIQTHNIKRRSDAPCGRHRNGRRTARSIGCGACATYWRATFRTSEPSRTAIRRRRSRRGSGSAGRSASMR